MMNRICKVTALFFAGMVLTTSLPKAQALPTGMNAHPIYDTTKAGLSFRKDNLSIVGMWEVPGNPNISLWLAISATCGPCIPIRPRPTRWHRGTHQALYSYPGCRFQHVGDEGLGVWSPGRQLRSELRSESPLLRHYNKYPNASQYRAGSPGTNGNNDGPTTRRHRGH